MPGQDEINCHFPENFLWGTATSAHQVEGGNDKNDWWAWELDGREKNLDHIYQNQVSGAACDWWEGRAEADIELMAELNTNAHRLSVEWSRIEPQQGVWDEDAIARYREILTQMVAAGIQPMITLHHFTIPAWFASQGSWLQDGAIVYFRRFTEKIAHSLGDLCTMWCTINEPNVYAMHGFFKGDCPPGKTGVRNYFQVLYSLMNAHAAAYESLHRIQPHARVGLAKHLILWEPHSRYNPLDRAFFWLLKQNFNTITIEALQTGRWRPTLGRNAYLPRIKGTLDWIGVNYYQRYDTGINLRTTRIENLIFFGRPGPEKGPEWWGEFYPDGLLVHLLQLHERFRLPVYITENGVPDPDDRHRPHYIIDHLARVWQAIQQGVQVRGYYHWSLVDNFEWAEGYNPAFRFGLYAVDWETQERAARQSAAMYREIVRGGKISAAIAEGYAPKSLASLMRIANI